MPDTPPIPLVDLALQHAPIAEELEAAMGAVVRSNAFVLGPAVSRFEEAYAQWAEVEYVVGVANGTDAIELLLRAVGVTAGDDVLVPAMTFVATASAVRRSGARPVLVDVDAETLLIDPDRVAAARTPDTRALIGVDLYGQLADFEALERVAADLILLEDAAQSHGARRHGRAPGTFGAGATVSFYPGKNLGALGEAGAVMTSDATIASRVRSLRNHGGQAKYEHEILGTNSRLDSIQAAALHVKLGYIDEWNEQRREAAARYDRLLADVESVTRIGVLEGNLPVWHLFVVRVPDRDGVLTELQGQGIGVGIHYPDPIHRLGAFRDLGYSEGDFPVAEQAAREILSLPMYPGITLEQQQRVVAGLHRALSH